METSSFRELLNTRHQFPCEYAFKFVVPVTKEEELMGMLPLTKVKRKESSKGNYVSVTASRRFNDVDEVMNIYDRVSKIEGIISL